MQMAAAIIGNRGGDVGAMIAVDEALAIERQVESAIPEDAPRDEHERCDREIQKLGEQLELQREALDAAWKVIEHPSSMIPAVASELYGLAAEAKLRAEGKL